MLPTIDALYLPANRKRGSRMVERVNWVCDLAEPILGVDRDKGQHAYIRQIGEWLYITADVRDSLFFPSGHPRSGQSRYTWILQPDGCRFGYLVEGAALDAPG